MKHVSRKGGRPIVRIFVCTVTSEPPHTGKATVKQITNTRDIHKGGHERAEAIIEIRAIRRRTRDIPFQNL
jgi:hypothetical protein